MLHACVQRFDVTKNFEKFCKILGTKQALGNFVNWVQFRLRSVMISANVGAECKSSFFFFLLAYFAVN